MPGKPYKSDGRFIGWWRALQLQLFKQPLNSRFYTGCVLNRLLRREAGRLYGYIKLSKTVYPGGVFTGLFPAYSPVFTDPAFTAFFRRSVFYANFAFAFPRFDLL